MRALCIAIIAASTTAACTPPPVAIAIDRTCGARVVPAGAGADLAELRAVRDAANKRRLCLIDAAGDRTAASIREWWNPWLHFEGHGFRKAMGQAIRDSFAASEAVMAHYGPVAPTTSE